MASLTEKETPLIELLDFQPDVTSTKPGVLTDMQGAFPSPNGFQAMNSAAQVGSSGPGSGGTLPTGAVLAYYSDGTAAIFVGYSAHIFKMVFPVAPPISGNLWAEADNGQTYAATTPWQFFQFGDDVIAVASGVVPQVAHGSAGQFSALAGSPPPDATSGVAAGGTAFLFKGSNWFNAATGTDNDWVPNIQTQAGSGNLYDFPGPITAAATLFRNVIMFKQNAIWLAQFQGQSTAPWSVQVISDFTGTWGPQCIVILPNAIAFVGTDDFYITNGYTPQAIPNNLKKWFFANAPLRYRQFIQSQYDPENSVIYWYFVSANNPNILPSGGTVLRDLATTGTTEPPVYPDRFVAYNTRSQRWGVGYTDPGFLMPVELSVPTLPLFNTSYFLANRSTGFADLTQTFLYQRTGTPGQMTLTTGYMGMERHLSELFRVRIRYNTASPLIRAGVPTLIPYHNISLGDEGNTPDVQSDAGVLGEDGWFNVRQYDRWHKFQLSTTGPVEVMGYAFEARQGGLV